MTSAVAQLRPTRILLHTEVGATPLGFWWDQFAEAHKELLQVVEHDPVTSVYGHPVHVMAHKTDVLRLDALYNHGGVYLDLDVLVFRDFLPALNDHLRQHPEQDAVLIQERDGRVSLGNAIIISRPFSKFIALWKSNYHDFNDNQWSAHSTALPRKLAQTEPGASLLHQLPSTAFYNPDWDEALKNQVGSKLFLEELKPGEAGRYDFEAAGALGWHWWGHIIARQLDTWTPCLLVAQANRTVISRLMGRYVSEQLCQRWRASQKTA
jgi:hypothetical protein